MTRSIQMLQCSSENMKTVTMCILLQHKVAVPFKFCTVKLYPLLLFYEDHCWAENNIPLYFLIR